MEEVTIFTDGAAKGNPGPGGYGVVVSYTDHVLEIGARKENTTNNEMELRAAIEGLKIISKEIQRVSIYSDSKYVVEGAKRWIFNWVQNDWKTKAHTDVKHKKLWQELLPLLKQIDITWHKISGHVGIVGNERADAIASGFGDNIKVDLYNGPKNKYAYTIDDVSYDERKEDARKSAKKRQSQKAFSYVSAIDGIVEVHQSWKECENRVRGIAGAKFKKTLNMKEQQDFFDTFA